MPYLLHQRHRDEQPPCALSAQPLALVVPTGQHSGIEQYQLMTVAVPMAAALPGVQAGRQAAAVAVPMAAALLGDQAGRQAAWARASSAISEATVQLVPPPLGKNKRGEALITGAMRDLANKRRAACQLVSAISLQTCAAILDRHRRRLGRAEQRRGLVLSGARQRPRHRRTVDSCAFTNGPILGGRAAQRSSTLSLPPLSCKAPSLLRAVQ